MCIPITCKDPPLHVRFEDLSFNNNNFTIYYQTHRILALSINLMVTRMRSRYDYRDWLGIAVSRILSRRQITTITPASSFGTRRLQRVCLMSDIICWIFGVGRMYRFVLMIGTSLRKVWYRNHVFLLPNHETINRSRTLCDQTPDLGGLLLKDLSCGIGVLSTLRQWKRDHEGTW